VVADVTHPTPASQVTSEVQKLKAANPEILLQSSYFAEVSLFMKAFAEQDFNVAGLLGNNGGFTDAPYLENMGATGDYIITRAMWAADIAGKKELSKNISEYYQEKFGVPFTENAGLPFMGVLVLADALNRAASTDGEALMQAIKETNFTADQNIFPWGISFDETQGGQNTQASAVIQQVQDNAYVTVWPFEVAAAEVVWPMPTWAERG
jgi:branched-chain amino acid transport system substrate-binding protein